MRAFVNLVQNLDATTSSNNKISYLKNYFESDIDIKDKLWALALFMGKKPPRSVNTSLLRIWCAEVRGIPLWLFEQNYHIVGDLAETIALMVADTTQISKKPLYSWVEEIFALKNQSESDKEKYVKQAWRTCDVDEIWIFNKIITGGFRIGVSKNLVITALSQVYDVEKAQMAHVLSGQWTPQTTTWERLLDFNNTNSDISKPYPYFLAYPIKTDELTQISSLEWVAEYKWDGIRGQLIYRKNESFLWSRGEELITEKFPELRITDVNTSFVIDGEILAWKNEKPMSFNELQPRISRKSVSKKMLSDIPIYFKAYDLLEINNEDVRSLPFQYRRIQLEKIFQEIQHPRILLSPLLIFNDTEELTTLRKNAPQIGAEGLMIKRWQGVYHTGRKNEDMYKWKCDPYLIDAVLLYAQRGHGRRANLYSDFTFAVWDGDKLTPFAKAYSGLTDQEMKEITQFVKKNTIETFGPVASVKPELVFELAFEGIALSSRHKSGIAVRFPRINRWRHDKKTQEANSLEDIKSLLVN